MESRNTEDVFGTALAREKAGDPKFRSDVTVRTPEDLESVIAAVPGGIENVDAVYPLSPLQEGMLFHCLMNEQRDTYELSIVFECASQESANRLIDSVQDVIARHDVLRTAVVWEGLPTPMQVVYRRAVAEVQELQLDARIEVVEQLQLLAQPGHGIFDLRRAPLLKLHVARDRGTARCYVLLRVHHLVCDHQSLRIIATEALAYFDGKQERLPPSLSYREYVAATLAHQQSANANAEAFFRRMLGDVREPTAPFGLLDVHGDGQQLEEAAMQLDSQLAKRLRTAAVELGTTPARLFHAAWALVVARTSGRDDIVLGCVVRASIQRSSDAQRMLGMAVNTLPLRLSLQEVTTRELVAQTRDALAELLQHEHVPLTIAQSCSGVAAATPLFTSLLNVRRGGALSQLNSSDGISVRVLARGEAWTNYPVTMLVDDLGDEFLLTAQVDRRVGSNRIIAYLQAATESLIDALQTDPERPVCDLSVLPEIERRLVLHDFNATRAEFPQEKLVHELFEERVKLAPDAIALMFEETSITYAELNRRANRLARYLRSRGIGPDCLVGICVDRSLEMVVGLLGIMKSGGAYVPLDPSYPPERLVYMIESSQPKVLLIQEHLQTRLPPTSATILALDTCAAEIEDLDATDLDRQQLGLSSRNLAYVIYTSGSTGRPKGAMNEHRAVVNRLLWMQNEYGLSSADRVLQKTPFSFDVSVWEFFWPLAMGACLVIARPQGHQDPHYLRALIDEAGVTTLHFVPSMLQTFVDHHQPGSCASIRRIVCSGEELAPLLQNKCMKLLPQARLANLYGPTEAAIDVTVWECAVDELVGRVPIGRPIWNIQMYVLDALLRPVPVGVPGEVYIGGVGVGRGYLNRPELTAERFVADPFSAARDARLYKSGDLGCWRADGAIEYLGRNDFQVKIRGLRIELGEIEAQLVRHPSVKEAVVVAREEAAGEKRLVAYIVAEGVHKPVAEELRAHVKATLPEYMVPSAFVVMERFPLSPNGKLDRRALPAPDMASYASRAYEPPEGELEVALARIWKSLLAVERVGRNDNFFELGGHSLRIVQMLDQLRELGLSIDVRRIFNSPTLADLASNLLSTSVGQQSVPPNLIPAGCTAISREMLTLATLEREHIEQVIRGVPGGAANVQDIYPLAPLQEGILFHSVLNGSDADPYVVPTLLSVSSRARLDQLVGALQWAIDQHEILRTAISWEQLPRPVQVVYRRAELPVDRMELNEQLSFDQQLRTWLDPERCRMDLRQAPLLRLRVAPAPDGNAWYVMFLFHHIIGDNTSREALIEQIVDRLEQRPLPQAEVAPYRNHVAHVLEYARTHDPERFFRAKLHDLSEPTAPFGVLDAHIDGKRITEARESLDTALGLRIRAAARRMGVTNATLFHAVWALVVGVASARTDVVFGSVLLGRMHGDPGRQRMLGLFINTLPLRLNVDVTVSELVLQTQRELVELLVHEQASLALAQSCSGVSAAVPLFTALLNYRHRRERSGQHWDAAQGVRMLLTQDRTNYPVSLSVDDLGQEFALEVHAAQPIDSERVLGYVRAALEALTEALEHRPNLPARSLSILPASERRQILEEFNQTNRSAPPRDLVHQLFEAHAQRAPNAIAATYGRHQLTYGELNGRANQLARFLRARGVRPETLVGICLDRSLEMIVAFLGVLKAGGAYVPLDPSYPTERLAYMLEDAAPLALLTERKLLDRFAAASCPNIALDDDWSQIAIYEDWDLTAGEIGVNSQHLAYVIYTSGSTGTPKGVMIQHASACNLSSAQQEFLDLQPDSKVLQFASPSFDACAWEWLMALCSGARLCLASRDELAPGEPLLQTLLSLEITHATLPPVALAVLPTHEGLKLSTLMSAGEACPPHIAERWRQGRKFWNGYGPTEATVCATAHQSDPTDVSIVPIGRPLPNTRVYVLDGRGNPVPIGVAGEVHVGGAGVARGYLHRPELTAQKFVPDPFSDDPRARLYRTGDLGVWRADGSIEYLGRNDNQVKIRGFRIELGEIEGHLARHSQVKEAAVVVHEQANSGKRLVAYLIPHEHSDFSVDGVRSYLRNVLPEFMVPSAFVVLSSFPVTPNGKLDRRALPMPGRSFQLGDAGERPHAGVEAAIAELWEEVLEVRRIGRQDNFFDLGGHSLLALRVLSALERSSGARLKITDLYQNPTVRDLAAFLGGDANENVRVDLDREAQLDDSIVPHISLPANPARNVLLTGATGFVGRFLLAQLLRDTDATIYCLVRAASDPQALARLKATLIKWDLWCEEHRERIVAVAGDLRMPRLGLAQGTFELLCRTVDSVFHCATSMNHLETYQMAKAANVDSARELLKLATLGTPKLVNYLSTLSVFKASDVPRVVNETSAIESEQHSTANGYVSSKWVGEKIFKNAMARGIPCNIFRVGLVWADTAGGRYDDLQHGDRILRSSLQSGYGIENFQFDMAPTPVDYVARSITMLTQQHPKGGGVFHISSSSSPQRSAGLFERCNELLDSPLQLLPYYEWILEIKRLHERGWWLPAVPLVQFAFGMDRESFESSRRTGHAVRFDCSRTHRELERVAIFAPELNEDLLAKTLQTMRVDAPLLETDRQLNRPERSMAIT